MRAAAPHRGSRRRLKGVPLPATSTSSPRSPRSGATGATAWASSFRFARSALAEREAATPAPRRAITGGVQPPRLATRTNAEAEHNQVTRGVKALLQPLLGEEIVPSNEPTVSPAVMKNVR